MNKSLSKLHMIAILTLKNDVEYSVTLLPRRTKLILKKKIKKMYTKKSFTTFLGPQNELTVHNSSRTS